MSREIKFRVWVPHGVTGEIKPHIVDICKEGNAIGGVIDNRIIVEQYTGLKDKNGKEIYDGDIVEWINGLGEYIKFVVEWQENRARFCLRSKYSEYDYEGLSDKKDPYLEVIGNIHENPELLENK